jgi:membrane-bound inhibitor of C-type lysozyme
MRNAPDQLGGKVSRNVDDCFSTASPYVLATTRLLGGIALAAALTGCYYDVQKAYQTPMPWGQRVEVACTGGKSMAIDFVPAPRAARVSFDGTSVTLPQVDSATDAKFTDGRYTLYVNEQRAALEETGILLRGPCTPR